MTNLLLIYIDDLFCYRLFRNSFGQTIQTPNLDRLESAATVFNAAYATVPVCLPSRTATMTGWSPFTSGAVANGGPDWYDLGPTRDNLSAALMRTGAYHIEWAGKIMHLYGAQPPEQARQLYHANMGNVSFTPDLGATDGSVNNIWPQSSFKIVGVTGKDAQFYDAQVAQYAIDMIGRQTPGKPWVMCAGFQHPHTSYACPQRFYDLYDAASIVEPTTWTLGDLPHPTEYAAGYMWDGTVWPSKDFANWQHHVRAYLTCVSHVDHEVGRLLDALEASPHADDTAIIVVSDHGYHAGDHDTWGKFTLWEESCRTPLVIKKPGQTTGSVVDTPVSLMDIYPTVLDLLGHDVPARIKGQSLLPLTPGGTGTYENRGAISVVYGCSGIRFGDFRYILYPDGTQELYDLVSDPSQAFNLVASQPAVVQTMRAQLVLESARYGLYHATTDLPSVKEARHFALFNGAKVEGGAADDTYIVSAGSDAEIKDRGGRNRVYLGHWTAGNPYTLPDSIEDIMIAAKRSPSDPVVHLNDKDNVIMSPQKRFIAHGGGGGDTMLGSNGSILYGDEGDDLLVVDGPQGEAHGGAGNDTLQSTGASLYGDEGNDHLSATRDPVVADGGSGDDTIIGGSFNDTLLGGTGNDAIDGGIGADHIDGGPGDDMLIGGIGDDTLVALGNDVLTGGPGVDTFIVGRAGTVQITDWSIGETIDLSAWADGSPTYRQINSNQVQITSGARSVLLASASVISPAIVQGSVVL